VADPRFHHRPRPPARRRGAKNANGETPDEARGRSRGGLSTKIHVGVCGLGPPVKVVLTAGQASDVRQADVRQAEGLIEGVGAEVVIGDKGYDSDVPMSAVQAKGGQAVIPPKRNRKVQRHYDAERYKDCNLVERFFNKVKHHRRMTSRYEKTARNFLAFVHVASIMALLW
jgi:transposase